MGDAVAVAHTGVARLGARVVPGLFAQTHARPELRGRTLLEILRGDEHARHGQRGDARALDRYELADCRRPAVRDAVRRAAGAAADPAAGAERCTLLLLDEPTDNLDLASAEALQEGLEAFEGTVLAVTHDRWFARSFDRFLVFGGDGSVYESAEPVWDEGRVERAR